MHEFSRRAVVASVGWIAASLVGSSPALADAIVSGVSFYTAANPPYVEKSVVDQGQVSTNRQDDTSVAPVLEAYATASGSAGPASASGYGLATSHRAVNGRSGTITWTAGGSAVTNFVPDPNIGRYPYGFVSSVNVSGLAQLNPYSQGDGHSNLRVAYSAVIIPQPPGVPYPSVSTSPYGAIDIPGYGRLSLSETTTMGVIDNTVLQGGDLRVVFPTLHVSSGSYNSSAPLDFQMVVTWGLGSLPGSVLSNPFLPSRVVAVENPAGVHRNEFDFAVPVQQGYGLGGMLYFDPEPASGYHYEVSGSRFASFLLPGTVPGAGSDLRLRIGGLEYAYTPGQIFDFTRYQADGIAAFDLLGIDASAGFDPTANHAGFTSGLSFTTPGLATVRQIALDATAVPEPSTLVLAGVGVSVLFLRLRRRRA